MPASDDLELGDMGKIQEIVQHLLDNVTPDRETSENEFQYSPTICMAPSRLRDLSPSSFDPLYVAIGPLHKKDEKVQHFENVIKPSYMNKLMRRIPLPREEILNSCVQKVYSLMERIKACYVQNSTSIIDGGIEIKTFSSKILIYSDVEIAKMMVMDAYFILECLYSRDSVDFLIEKVQVPQYAVFRDMLLLENQIPFFVLDEIFQCTIMKVYQQASLLEPMHPLLSFGYRCFDGTRHIIANNVSLDTPAHILGLVHESYKPKDNYSVASIPPKIHSAVDLDSAGVKFKPYQNSTWSLGMKVETYWFLSFFGYWCKPTLRMPRLIVRHDTESVIHNLIAYEHLTTTRSRYITSYVVAMDMLVKTQEDVDKLVDSNVLINYVDSDEQVAHIINNACKGVEAKDFLYKKEWETLSKYRQSNVAWLRRTYFNNPWNMIALFAGIILFCLTVVQTAFTIKSAK